MSEKKLKIFLSGILLIFLGSSFAYSQPLCEIPPATSEQFFGDHVYIQHTFSSRIGRLKFSVVLPEGFQLLSKAGSTLKILDSDKKTVAQFPIKALQSSWKLNRVFGPDKFYVRVLLHYCRKGKAGVCLIKDVLFEIPLNSKTNLEDVALDYKVVAPN